MTDTKEASEKLVRDFLGAWVEGDIDTICSAFADGAVYHNVPVKPIKGIAGIRAIFEAFLGAFEQAELDIVTLAAEPGLVLAERIDYFTMKDGRKVVLPVSGVFVVEMARSPGSATISTLPTSSGKAASSCENRGFAHDLCRADDREGGPEGCNPSYPRSSVDRRIARNRYSSRPFASSSNVASIR